MLSMLALGFHSFGNPHPAMLCSQRRLPCRSMLLASRLIAGMLHLLSYKCPVASSAQVRTPLYGCDCYAYGLLASGFCDLVVEADLKPYDYMALVPIVTGAGGIITDWQVRIYYSQRRHRRSLAVLIANVCHVLYEHTDAGLSHAGSTAGWKPDELA